MKGFDRIIICISIETETYITHYHNKNNSYVFLFIDN